MALTKYESVLLEGWEDVYKKAQLTLWILLALKDAPKAMVDIKQFISERTQATITADDKSMYRALRRFTDAELITFNLMPSKNGPDKKLYQLTQIGNNTLAAFIERNISSIFFNEDNKELFSR